MLPAQSSTSSRRRTTRQYRSKRRQPCEPCRESKSRCPPGTGFVCQRCVDKRIECYFATHADNVRLRSDRRVIRRSESTQQDRSGRSTTPATEQHQNIIAPVRPNATTQVNSDNVQRTDSDGTLENSGVAEVDTGFSRPIDLSGTPRISTQISQTLDSIEHHSALIFGASSDADPWLLRHCKFNDYGLLKFDKMHFRHAGGVPIRHKIPIHFLVYEDTTYKSETEDSQGFHVDDCRRSLDKLVPPAYGPRLIALFCKHVFPFLPVISRSQLGMTSPHSIVDQQVLSALPVHLLAAIYASALPFIWDDSYLSIVYAGVKSNMTDLWQMVLELINYEIRSSHLSTIQAMILYINRTTRTDSTITISDNHFLWSLMGSVVGLATSLGLHIECSMWAIPARDKRLRRRLWWAIYCEDKWRSLLSGRPPYIRRGEWDTSDLQAQDFFLSPNLDGPVLSEISELPFCNLVRLSFIAEQIYDTFYLLKAAQRLCEDFNSSLQAARPLVEQLIGWRTSSYGFNTVIPETGTLRNNRAACIEFAYLVLMTYVYRALIRSMVLSTNPPEVIDIDEIFQNMDFSIDNNRWIFSDTGTTEFIPPVSTDNDAEMLENTFETAQNCGATLVSFLRQLTFSDLGTYWYSWSNLGFSTASNFIMLLLVQAPSLEHAARAMQLLEPWWQLLRSHKISSPNSLVDLGLMRLNMYHMNGLTKTFSLPKHVRDVISREQGNPQG